MSGYPMWHKRFMESRNLLSRATAEMEQAVFEDRNNPKFRALHKQFRNLLTAVDDQLMENYKRVMKG